MPFRPPIVSQHRDNDTINDIKSKKTDTIATIDSAIYGMYALWITELLSFLLSF